MSHPASSGKGDHADSTAVGFARHDHRHCVERALRLAERQCELRRLKLTSVRRRVLEILLESHTAMGAYEVLERLNVEGYGSKPPLAYRALGFLTEQAFVHRIERLNAYVACAHPGARHDPAFMICTACGSVAETQAAVSRSSLGKSAREAGFAIEQCVLEVTGLCPTCQNTTLHPE